ncbi:KpsF/GutQ family sugar-phosphate isomerase [Desulfonatronovibrio magnus]|uniref:KpsF/GutQ family sugar-phosphate isomerase n=1 Tax=Desulfonatronovibrio magnus TaxID=698827 RepID=UPI001E335DF4|nr:KpsF/GutQ family sugar-phosphate isomerase [Desulfonatronovibrio magnus]
MSGSVAVPFDSHEYLDLARTVLDIEIEGIKAVKEDLDHNFSTALSKMAACSGRIVITGIGKSGLIGRKIAATLSSTGTPSFYLHPVESAHGDMGMITCHDLILAISNSGETDELNSIIPSFKALGVSIIAITSDSQSSMALLSDITIKVKVPREACMLGLAPTASTTAALAVGDALAICLMRCKHFEPADFQRYHPGGFLGQRLGKNILELMHTQNLPVADHTTSLQNALAVLNQAGFGVVFIVDDQNILHGVITDGDVRRMVCADRIVPTEPVSRFMNPSPLSVDSGVNAGVVLDIMEENTVTVLPIVDQQKKIMGIIHLHDLLGKGKYKFSVSHA